MLLNRPNRQSGKRIAILTRSPLLTELLTAILVDWGFLVVEQESEPDILFIEYGLPSPRVEGRIIWLTPLPGAGDCSLVVPLSLTRLYHLVEDEFFPAPRRHIRISTDLDVDLQLHGTWHSARIVSFSDRGGRLVFDRELPNQQKLTLDFKLGRRNLRLSAVVLYSLPPGETPGRQQPQLGILFKPIDEAICRGLRSYVERCCLEKAFKKIGLDPGHPVGSWFDLDPDSWAAGS